MSALQWVKAMLTYTYRDGQCSNCLILTRNGSFGNFNREIQKIKQKSETKDVW